MSAGLLASTTTPGTTLRVASVTCPAMVACARAVDGERRATVKTIEGASGVGKGTSLTCMLPSMTRTRQGLRPHLRSALGGFVVALARFARLGPLYGALKTVATSKHPLFAAV